MFDIGSLSMQQRDRFHPAQSTSAVTGLQRRLRKAPFQTFDAQAQSLLDTTAMIRSLQRSEGEEDCYRRGRETCDRIDCPWRRYCFHTLD